LKTESEALSSAGKIVRADGLLSLAKYGVLGVAEKSGRRAAALQIASAQYYAGLLSRGCLPRLRENAPSRSDDKHQNAGEAQAPNQVQQARAE
jgi:hypothetical protein